MPDLAHTLQGHDLSFLKMVAQGWGVELNAPDARSALTRLVQALANADLAREVVEALPAEARRALQTLLENEGRMLWVAFARKFGDVRNRGAAWRDRHRPDLHPASPAEVLWYRGLIGRAFLNLTTEPQEFAYVPDDLLALLAPLAVPTEQSFGRVATPGERAHFRPASDHILDHACTLLAALRLGLDLETIDSAGWPLPAAELRDLLYAARLLDAHGLPLPEPTRAFLEAPRAQALALLSESWANSAEFNDLRHVPGLVLEGEWHNDPLAARRSLMDLLSHLPQEAWWSLASFVDAVRENRPDFQRPAAGDYQSWFIRKAGSEDYLRGFSAWDEVDGALIRQIITGPMHWLGFFDLSAPAEDAPPAAFRPTAWAAELWSGRPPAKLSDEDGRVSVYADGRIRVPRLTPRAVRYQIARFSAWQAGAGEEYRYRITPDSLERAGHQGLKPAHLVALLKKQGGPLPPPFLQALERWEQHGVQARLESAVLLRVSSPEVLAAVRASAAARYLGEELNATTMLVRRGSEEKLVSALAEAGLLAQVRLSGNGGGSEV
ncbi:MAG TPA: helicase-associated domain-containing protein [Anaerolineaceae bacterium]|nr:helicase-associated domain-containing protein [Anaerolineaceae bacterium]